MRALGNRDARRDDVAIHRPFVADVDLLARRDVAGDFAEDDHRLGEHLRLDFAVRANGEHVVAKLDGAFDLTFDGQILAPIQFAFDDDGFTDVHVVPL
jgi:hypothetical protein